MKIYVCLSLEVAHVQGKFLSREALEDIVVEMLDDAMPTSLEDVEGSEYEVTDSDIQFFGDGRELRIGDRGWHIRV